MNQSPYLLVKRSINQVLSAFAIDGQQLLLVAGSKRNQGGRMNNSIYTFQRRFQTEIILQLGFVSGYFIGSRSQ